MLLAYPKGLQIVGQKFHDELFVAWVTPAIAFDTVDKHFAVMVDFHYGRLQ